MRNMRNIIPNWQADPNEDTDVLVEEVSKTKKEDLVDIIIYNDDVNTFEFVQKCLMEICGHDEIQAVQCSQIIHNNGKCSVKRGTFKKLRPLCEALIDRQLSATIE